MEGVILSKYRAYTVITLKWLITLAIAYGAYTEAGPYIGIGIIWAMLWHQALGFVVGNLLIAVEHHNACISVLMSTRITEDAKAIEEIIKRMEGDDVSD